MMDKAVMLAGVLMLAMAQASAESPPERDTAAVRFAPLPGVSVQAALGEDGALDVLLQPSGKRQRLQVLTDVEGDARLGAEDVDFDGHPELVVRAAVGMVNEAVEVFRYDRQRDELRALQPEPTTQASCGSLMMLVVEPRTQTLRSSCRSGPLWYADLYRFDGPRLYLYRSQRVIHALSGFDALQVDALDSEGPLAVWSTYRPGGARMQAVIGDALAADAPEQGIGARVLPVRLPLFANPGDAGTRRYLVQGDRVELLDERDGWLQVRYRNPTRGAIEGWLSSSGDAP